jgi:transcriptional regulator with GAF, ATPase, and Fis domain
MEQMHNRLKLQIRRYFGAPESLPKEWRGFIKAVNTDYVEFDAERAPLERAPLEETNWVLGGPKGAAARLGMKRATLQHRMRKLGISRPST